MSEIAGAPQVNQGTSFAGFLLGSEERTYLGAIGQTDLGVVPLHLFAVRPNLEVSRETSKCGATCNSLDQRSVGNKLLGTFITDLYGARLTASYAGALISLEFTETTDGTGIRNHFGGTLL